MVFVVLQVAFGSLEVSVVVLGVGPMLFLQYIVRWLGFAQKIVRRFGFAKLIIRKLEIYCPLVRVCPENCPQVWFCQAYYPQPLFSKRLVAHAADSTQHQTTSTFSHHLLRKQILVGPKPA